MAANRVAAGLCAAGGANDHPPVIVERLGVATRISGGCNEHCGNQESDSHGCLLEGNVVWLTPFGRRFVLRARFVHVGVAVPSDGDGFKFQ